MNLTELLISNSEENYELFSKKLIPDTSYEILGVRVPKIKEIARLAVKNSAVALSFLKEKHDYYEEYFLHGIILGNLKTDFNIIMNLLDDFLPYIDNWAICDSTVSAMKIFKKHKKEVFEKISRWIKSDKPYTVRFAVVTLLQYFVDDEYIADAISLVYNACSNHYYVNMAIAWFFSVALVKQYDKTVGVLENKSLPKFIQNKSIQKAIESFRIDQNTKNYLRTLKI